MTLTQFLLARIGEDEEVHPQWGFPMNVVLHGMGCMEFGAVERSDATCDCGMPARYLAECEAKRQMVAIHGRGHQCSALDMNGWYGSEDGCPECVTLKLLALPYAEHSDYREEWRP